MRFRGHVAMVVSGLIPVAMALAAASTAFANDDQKRMTGQRAFQKCYACHSLEGPDPALQGPSLRGIVGRAVASEAGYQYSPAMRSYAARQAHWTRAALDAFLTDPQDVVPNNAMGFYGIRKPEERAALIDYLESCAD